MTLLFFRIIVDETKVELPKNSYLKLRNLLLDIQYNSERKCQVMRRIDKII